MEREYKFDMVANNLLLKVKSGSHLYGLSTPESDVDYLGVVYEPLKYKLGFNTFHEIDLSVKDKHENGRNTKDAIDEKYYSLTKFVDLLFANNPTIIELLFAKDCIHRDPLIDVLWENRNCFLKKKGIENAFIGYAISQEKKMELKADNKCEITKLYERIKDIHHNGVKKVYQVFKSEPSLKDLYDKYEAEQTLYLKKIEEIENQTKYDPSELNSYSNKVGNIMIGTRLFSSNMLFKKLKTQLRDSLATKSSRNELWDKFGFDTKFASHYLRLLLQGEELLLTGDLKFPLKDRDFLLDVKMGKYTREEILEKGKELKARIRESVENSVISDKQNKTKIENIILDFYKDKYGFKGE